MKNCIISILNNTDFTPEIIQANLTNCNWVYTQSIVPPKAIASHHRVVGMVEGNPVYKIQLEIRFYLYSENIQVELTVHNDSIEAWITHSDHILCNFQYVEQEDDFLVFLELDTFVNKASMHPEAMVTGKNKGDHLVVRAGTARALIDIVEQQPDGKADNISVNLSKECNKITPAILAKLTKSEAFRNRKEVTVAWQKKIEQKQGLIRDNPLKGNKYHALLENLSYKDIGGLFVNYPNPNYQGKISESVLSESTLKGIDVSHHNGDINWSEVKAAGIPFTFIKATEGNTFIDPQFEKNWSEAANANILRSPYHFYRFNVSPEEQAAHFIKVVGDLAKTDMPPTLDLEWNYEHGKQIKAPKDLVANVVKWCEFVKEKYHKNPIIYTNGYFLDPICSKDNDLSSYTLYLSGKENNIPTVWEQKSWTFWQNSTHDRVNGIEGMVDQDTFKGSLNDLLVFIDNSNLG